MGIMKSIGAAFGFGGTTGPSSPWREDGILEEITLAGLYGDVSMIPVSASRALRLSVIAKARRVLVHNLARLPLIAFDRTGQPHATQPWITARPDATTARANTIAWIATELLLHPCAYTLVTERNSYGFPSHIVPVDRADAQTNDMGQLIAVGGKDVNPADTLRFDSLDGGILAEGSDTIRRALVLNRVAAIAEENPLPVVELHNEGDDIGQEKIKEMINQWRMSRAKHGVGYSSKGVKVISHGARPENLLIDGRKRIDLELARHCNLPAWAADVPIDGSSLTYQNRQSKNQELIDQFISGFSTVIEERLSLPDVTPQGTTVRFQFDELTKPDMKTRFETYGIGKAQGFITNQQIADWEGWAEPAPETKDTAQ